MLLLSFFLFAFPFILLFDYEEHIIDKLLSFDFTSMCKRIQNIKFEENLL